MLCFGFFLFGWWLGFLTSGRKGVQFYLQRVKSFGSPEPGTHGTLCRPRMGLRRTLLAHIPKEEQTHRVTVPKGDFDKGLSVASSLTRPQHNPGLCSGSFINPLLIFEKRNTEPPARRPTAIRQRTHQDERRVP